MEVYSSNQRLVQPPAGKKRNVTSLQPDVSASIAIVLKANQAGISEARIHCVDIHSKELVHAWILQVDADKPLL